MYLCIANHFMTTKMLTARQRVYAPVVRCERCYKSDWRRFLTGRGLFLHPPPKGFLSAVLAQIYCIFILPAIFQHLLYMLNGFRIEVCKFIQCFKRTIHWTFISAELKCHW